MNLFPGISLCECVCVWDQKKKKKSCVNSQFLMLRKHTLNALSILASKVGRKWEQPLNKECYTSVANISVSPPKVWVLLVVPEDMPGK